MQRINSRGSGQTFVYRFDMNDANNCFRARQDVDSRWHGHLRAIHMDDLCYLFRPSFVDTSLLAEHSLDLIDHMVCIVKCSLLSIINLKIIYRHQFSQVLDQLEVHICHGIHQLV